ncbi:helix-turn-helix transcriptional regulator [Nocardia sp. NPDC004860]|uniref:helix-turn-helix domain-containing protein n=1 Tax=Nocardia sp. NPDC004860 TaxID=3154557 RepID=UPI0033BC0E5C
MVDREQAAALNRAFGQQLLALRQSRRLTVARAWQGLGWTRNTYQRTEDGQRNAKLIDLFEVAAFYEVSPLTIVEAVTNTSGLADPPCTRPTGRAPGSEPESQP